jgi:hypothetical protein
VRYLLFLYENYSFKEKFIPTLCEDLAIKVPKDVSLAKVVEKLASNSSCCSVVDHLHQINALLQSSDNFVNIEPVTKVFTEKQIAHIDEVVPRLE